MKIISKIDDISSFFIKGGKKIQKSTKYCSSNSLEKVECSTKQITDSKRTPVVTLLKNIFKHVKYKLLRPYMQLIHNVTLIASIPYLEKYISKNFNNIKRQLLKLELDKDTLNKIENSESSGEIANIIKSIKYNETMKHADLMNLTILDCSMSGKEKFNLIMTAKKEYNTKMLSLEKALSCPSVDPKVIEIEEILKRQYGMEFVSLKDDYEHAQKLLNACKLMAENGLPVPKNYIVSNMLPGVGQCLQTESTILHIPDSLNKIVNPKTKSKIHSIDSDIHSIIHEFGHNIQPETIDIIEIPQRFKSVPKTISRYAAMGSNAELWAELFAKMKLNPESVTQQQKELFEYLKNCGVFYRSISF